MLDDTFQEDRCRLRTGHAARNMAALRRIALNILTLLKQYFWSKLSIRRLRKMVARNPARLEPIMALRRLCQRPDIYPTFDQSCKVLVCQRISNMTPSLHSK